MRPASASGENPPKDDRMDGADPRAGQHRIGGLGDHRHVDGDPVALLDAVGLHHVGKPADLIVKLAIGDLLVVIGLSPSQMIAVLIAALLQVPVDAVVGDVGQCRPRTI
jgi:hypothetical protein